MRAARDGANIIIAAKTATAHPKLPGTIYTAAEEVEQLGGKALPVVCDIRDETQVQNAINKAVERFGGIDIVVNNASAISTTDSVNTTTKKYDLMNQVNARGTWLVSKLAIPHLRRAKNPHILILAPPLNMEPRWFASHVPYSIAKFGMSMCVLGMAEEFRSAGIAVNALWPLTVIHTAALNELSEFAKQIKFTRKPDIMADAAHLVLGNDSRSFTGNFCIDEVVLREAGVVDLTKYQVDQSLAQTDLMPDLFVSDEQFQLVDKLRAAHRSRL
ncbi:Hydroxysteroid dehydrogenase-like protein 2 [Dispira simplex]|nr:Hydroxysteroid dehydrogenase-like protein 2 [Dispira simplex]